MSTNANAATMVTTEDKRRKRKRRQLASPSLERLEGEDNTQYRRRSKRNKANKTRKSHGAPGAIKTIDSLPLVSPLPNNTGGKSNNGQSRSSNHQKLSNDVLWYLARTFLWQPDDVYRLARTSRSLWRTLEREVYLTDVFVARHYSDNVNIASLDDHSGNNGSDEQANQEEGQGQGQGQEGSGHGEDDDEGHSSSNSNNNHGDEPQPRPVRTTLLHWAAVAGRLDTLHKAVGAARQLWPAYVDYQHGMCGHTALHFAAHYGRQRAVEALAAAGPGLCDVAVPSGWVCPAPQRLGAILDRLVPGRFRVPPEYLLHSGRHPFRTDALGLAILKGHAGVARWFARRWRRRRRQQQHGGTYAYDDDGGLVVSPLHLAALAGMHDVVATLLPARGEKGEAVAAANFRCRHVEDSTPLMWAVAGRGGGRRLDTIRLLVDHGADPALRDNRRRTALDWAIGFKVPENVRWLLETFPEPESEPDAATQGTEGEGEGRQQYWPPDRVETWTKRLQRCMADDCFLECTQLIVARYARRLPETCLRLCAHSTFWDIDRSWDEPGCVSTASKNIETKRWLVEEGIGLGALSRGAAAAAAEGHHQDGDDDHGGHGTAAAGWMQEELFLGRSFLHYAAGSNDVGPALLGQVLARRARDVNVPDARGLTPLELALGYRSQPGKVQLLLRHGANPRLCFGGERAREDIDRQIRELMCGDGDEDEDGNEAEGGPRSDGESDREE